MQKQEIFNKIKSGEIDVDKLLYPERHISEISPSSLRIDVLSSGFPSLDDLLFLKDKRSELIVIGGRPSMGKSALMFQLAYNLAHEMPVHVFSLEMDKEQILTRLIAARINRSITQIQRGYVDDAILNKAHRELSALKYFIDDRAGINVNMLCDAAAEAHARHGTKVIIIDYLQLLRSEKGYSKDDEVGKITRRLKELAKELRVPVIIGSQLNRECERRGKDGGDYRPIMSDLRESGNIEQDADIIAFIHRQSQYNGERPGKADIIVAKNRNGATANIELQFCANQTRFIDEKGIDI